MAHFATSMEHLFAELERIDLLVRAQVAHQRQVQAEDAQFQGLYISGQEVGPGAPGPGARPAGLRLQ